MVFIPVDSNLLPLASKFIEPCEETCVYLSSYLRRGSKHVFLISKIPNPSSPSDLHGVIYNDSSVFHCIPHPENFSKEELFELKKFFEQPGLSPLFQSDESDSKKIKCISGEAKTTAFLTALLKTEIGEPYQTNHYNLMTAFSIINPTEQLYNDDEIVRCSENDLESLLPIQKEYMNSEVAPFGKKATDAEISMSLRQILKNQLCLALYSDGEIVAKANTNAIGINWIQLGGIYTHPLYRRNGYAWQLISAILRRTSKAGKKAALFVKDINVPAMELYKKIGFTNSGLYTIGYY